MSIRGLPLVSSYFLVLYMFYYLIAGANSFSSASEGLSRRNWFDKCAGVVGTGFVVLFPESAHANNKLTLFEDTKHGFSMQVPSEWSYSEQNMPYPDRRTIKFWTDPTDSNTFLFIAYTPLRDDFTSLGSFGSVDQVAYQTILPKGKLAGENVEASMLSASSAKQAYFFDYKQLVPNIQPETHFRTIFTLQQGATGGAGAVLVSITAQTTEKRYQEELKDMFDSIITSYTRG